MFTWEEAGQLRSMMLVLKWTLVALVLGVILLEHEPLGAMLSSGLHFVQGAIRSTEGK
jgi:hypothetical protein